MPAKIGRGRRASIGQRRLPAAGVVKATIRPRSTDQRPDALTGLGRYPSDIPLIPTRHTRYLIYVYARITNSLDKGAQLKDSSIKYVLKMLSVMDPVRFIP